jgi:S-adenosylmethionine synthetase
MADQVSDAVLDAILAVDPKARVACESLLKTGYVMLAGEITLTKDVKINYPAIVREAVRSIGYTSSEIGFDADTCGVLLAVEEQSKDINQGVDRDDPNKQGAGDQGMMFGYACTETDVLMPMPICYAHALTKKLADLRKTDPSFAWLRPDAKSQVSVRYENDKPVSVDTVVVSTQHHPDAKEADIRAQVIDGVIKSVIPAALLNGNVNYFVNPTGRFVTGGPMGDCGLTGRKIIVDTYGGMGRHGGGAFSGKDPSKVDRSAAYMARYLAKNVVASGLARACEVQLAYAIGVAQPVSVHIDTFGTGKIAPTLISQKLREHVDLRPASIVELFQLKRPIYRKTAAYGHFGRSSEGGFFPWEKTDLAAKLG